MTYKNDSAPNMRDAPYLALQVDHNRGDGFHAIIQKEKFSLSIQYARHSAIVVSTLPIRTKRCKPSGVHPMRTIHLISN
ncbi:MAG: hypothetical protein ACK47M_24485, partial [Caldilinea sp.]